MSLRSWNWVRHIKLTSRICVHGCSRFMTLRWWNWVRQIDFANSRSWICVHGLITFMNLVSWTSIRDLGSRFCAHEFAFMGVVGSWVWVHELRFMAMRSWGYVHEFGFMNLRPWKKLRSWIWVHGDAMHSWCCANEPGSRICARDVAFMCCVSAGDEASGQGRAVDDCHNGFHSTDMFFPLSLN